MSDYQRIEKAIHYILENQDRQPSLEDIAAAINLSPFHFQRLFSHWAGITPKRFLQIITLERAKELLSQSKPLLAVSEDIGLSGTARLHDHFVSLEAVTPGQYKTAGAGLNIKYSRTNTPFGSAFIAATDRGICKISFLDVDTAFADPDRDLAQLQQDWPSAKFTQDSATIEALSKDLFEQGKQSTQPLSLHVRGTNFQVMVWRALLQIPSGELQSYANIAQAIGKPKAVRAVGTAIGANPLAFVIPCHRVIQQSGGIGGYRWGTARKHAIHAWESAYFG